MAKTVINTNEELKDFVSKNRNNIININGVQFGKIYPMIEVTKRQAAYYDVDSQEYKFLYAPFTIEYKVYDDVIDENNHPCRDYVIGKSKEELLNKRAYVVGAIEAWKENWYDATPDRIAYNINYFKTELEILDKELSRF